MKRKGRESQMQMRHLKKPSLETESRMVVFRDPGREKWGVVEHVRVSVSYHEKVLEICCVTV